MANVSKVNGFRPVKYLNGTPWNGQARKYVVLGGDSTALAVGDIVDAAAGSKYGYQAVTRMASGTAGAAVIGVVVGVDPIGDAVTSLDGNTQVNLTAKYRVASTEQFVWVVDDPNVVFEAEFDSAGDQPDQVDVGLNYDVDLGAGTNTTTGLSSMSIDASSEVTTAATPLQLVGLVQRPDVDITDAGLYQRGLVIFNAHARKGTGTAGV